MCRAGIAPTVRRLSMGWKLGFQSHTEAKNSSSTKPYRPAVQPTQSVIQWIPWSFLGGGVKRVWGVMLTAHLHQVPSQRMSESVHSLPYMPSWPGQG
jgi:hypothetical protein